ncbi:MAG: hypothetical protein K2X81_10600 [Candidatus Obscuribacterales bacterium]|nr:hypothetical protein [Candidatus Obscuribacterales bacterium]
MVKVMLMRLKIWVKNKTSLLRQVTPPKHINPLLVLAITLLVAPSALAQTEEQDIEAQAKKVFKLQKQNAEQGKFTSQKDAAQYTDLLKKISKNQSPEKARKTNLLANLITKYRAEIAAFGSAGGVELSNLKTMTELNNRLSTLTKAKGTLTEVINTDGHPLPGLILEQKVLENLLAQLNFYKKHWGKWQMGPKGPLFDLPQSEIDYLNGLFTSFEDLKKQQLNRLKNAAQENLEMLDNKGN